jgi:hypothetical protein
MPTPRRRRHGTLKQNDYLFGGEPIGELHLYGDAAAEVVDDRFEGYGERAVGGLIATLSGTE